MEQSAESSTSTKAWTKQKNLKEERVISIEKVIELAQSIGNIRNRSLFVLTYLTAGRIQEIVRKKNKKTGEIRPSIRKSDVSIVEKDGIKILLINIRNQKHKTRKRKDIPVPLDRRENALLFNEITDYLNTLKNEEEMFPVSYQYAYKVISKLGFNPHWIRHIRLTHLVTKYGYKEHQLRVYAGWTDSRPAKSYIEMNWEDLIY